ncbi:MAG TPA: NADH-quinone oxidoreductase subunit NuoH [Nakamurella multipartita]|uniref:NADH-quinone oxidoreductase subunit H n=2 Tax=Nakamurella TaxID=53460 RepID=C8XBC8_NAKMY|nr:NADH-quinone oxidoreductase subunit NuoH [Nakamurella multipartita]ACV77390.1 NADH dehydrogenase (quinone) [Nakamurella multipartita DSM 44233]HOZ56615.1 NADH-quinone oxidoreductase subunit NuoH [Nakamurella multipartita]
MTPAPLPDGSVEPLLADDPWWLMLIKALLVFVILLLLTLFAIWFERRVVGRMQHRPGPNWNGPFGLLQSLADALKLHFKEGIIPAKADKVVYILAPAFSAIPAFLIFSIIPVGGQVTMFGEQTALQLIDPPVGVLVALALASVGVYGIVLGGWASGSTYPLLGGLRSAAQMISYDVAMGLSFVAVFLYAGTLSTSAIVTQQQPGWYVWLLPVSFIVYCVSMVGETNRAPFDLAEAEGELVGGFNTEYSSMRFGLFFLAEYINLINVSAIATTLFLGGWMAPWPISLLPWANTGYWTMLWFFIKVLLFMFVFVWLRGTLPRIRYDQFMAIGWKVMIPISLVWIVLVGSVRVLRNAEGFTTTEVLLWVGIPLAVIIVAAIAWPPRRKPELVVDLPDEDVASAPPDGTVVAESRGTYPVPPLDLAVPVPPIRARLAAARAAESTPALTPAGVGRDLPGGSNSGGSNVVS